MAIESISFRARHVQTLFDRKGFVVADMATEYDFGLLKPLRYIFKAVTKPLVVGATYVLTGSLMRHAEHGVQFEVSGYMVESRLTTALLNGEIPSIGKETGLRIWNLLKDDFETLSSIEPLLQLSGVGKKKAFSILANIAQFKESIK